MNIPNLEHIVEEFYPCVSTRLHAKLSLDLVDGQLVLTYEEHKPDGSFGDPISWHFELTDA